MPASPLKLILISYKIIQGGWWTYFYRRIYLFSEKISVWNYFYNMPKWGFWHQIIWAPPANGLIPGLSGSLFFMVRNTACILVRKGWVEVPLSCLMAVTVLLENWMVLRRDISAASRRCCCSPTHNTSAQGSGSSSWNTGDYTNSKRFVNKLGTYPGNLGPPLPLPFFP